MKVIRGAIVLALFLAQTEAIVSRQRNIDTEYEESVKEEEDQVKSKHSKQGIANRLAELQRKDQEIIQEYSVQLDQSQRNINQGEMGQSLAQSKIMSVKNSFELLATNIQDEANTLKEGAELDRKTNKDASPEKVQADVDGLKQRTDKILTDLQKVQGMESDLKDKGSEAPAGSLFEIEEKMNNSIKQAQDYVKGYKSDVENKQKEDQAAKEEALGVSNPRMRSQKDKDEMNAFLSGSAF